MLSRYIIPQKPTPVKSSLTAGMSKELPDLNSRQILHLNNLCSKALAGYSGESWRSSAKISCALWGNLELQVLCAVS